MILGATGVSNGFVVLLGIGTVFVGLVCIILLLELVHIIVAKFAKPDAPKPVNNTAVTTAPIENREEIIAAVSAAVAEELGTDVSAIRILSFKKIN